MINLKEIIEKAENDGIENEKKMLIENFEMGDSIQYYQNYIKKILAENLGRELSYEEYEVVENYIIDEWELWQVNDCAGYYSVSKDMFSVCHYHEFDVHCSIRMTPNRKKIIEESLGVMIRDYNYDEQWCGFLVYNPISLEIDLGIDMIENALLERVI